MNASCAEERILPLAVYDPPLSQPLPQRRLTAKTPVKVDALAPWLSEYPDLAVAELLRDGFEFRFFYPFLLNWDPQ